LWQCRGCVFHEIDAHHQTASARCAEAGLSRKTEVTTLADAARLLRFARSVGISTISMWAVEGDHGTCRGRIDSNMCSGIVQPDWAFNHLLEPFTGR